MSFEALILAVLLATFNMASVSLGEAAFAGILWSCYFCFSGVYAMHPAVCNRVFGPKIDFVAIGLIGEFVNYSPE